MSVLWWIENGKSRVFYRSCSPMMLIDWRRSRPTTENACCQIEAVAWWPRRKNDKD